MSSPKTHDSRQTNPTSDERRAAFPFRTALMPSSLASKSLFKQRRSR